MAPHVMTTAERPIEPLRLLSVGALAAGWYLVSRVALRSLPFWLVPMVASLVIVQAGYAFPGAVVFASGIIAGLGAVIRHSGRVTSRWAELRWGRSLVEEDDVWLSILGRTFLATLGFCVVTAPIGVVGATAVPSALAVLGVAQIVFGVAAVGRAMSRVASTQLVGAYGRVATEGNGASARSALALAPDATDRPNRERLVARPSARRSSPAPGSRLAADPPSEGGREAVGTAAGEKLQCPKCKLYETELGAVIGWYCRICGWRESRG